jgi:hypothetical protein
MFDSILKIFGSFLGIFSIVWIACGLYLLNQIEKEIFVVKDEIDNLENDETSKHTLRSGMVNQSQFEKITLRRRKPLLDKLEILKLKRQFILDKLPLLGIFKK